MDQQENKIKENKGASRRKFITRASAGLVVAALPARSVWAGARSGSIVASGNSSLWNEGSEIQLLSHGFWKNNGNWKSTFGNNTFEDVFGTKPFDDAGNPIVIRLRREKSDGTFEFRNYQPKLKKMIGCEGNKGVVLNFNNGWEAIANSNDNPTFLKVANRGPKFDLSGPSNLNVQMIAMLLNAMHDGMYGLHYPMIGAGRPFADWQGYAEELGYLAQANKFSAGTELDNLIQTYHA